MSSVGIMNISMAILAIFESRWFRKNHTHVKKVGHNSKFLFGIY